MESKAKTTAKVKMMENDVTFMKMIMGTKARTGAMKVFI